MTQDFVFSASSDLSTFQVSIIEKVKNTKLNIKNPVEGFLKTIMRVRRKISRTAVRLKARRSRGEDAIG